MELKCVNDIEIVIGSWGSYNECNERALGSKWIKLNDYESYDEIEEELKKQGFELDGIDEELFIQDVDNLDIKGVNWDYMHPKRLFEVLKESGVLDNSRKKDLMEEYLSVRSWNDFTDLVDSNGDRWDDDIIYYDGYDWEDYGREMFEVMGYNIPRELENFIDFEEYGRYMGSDLAEETDNGIIEIRD